MKNTSRRAHKKTRTGCAQCKRRKVKCDEGKPTCNNCERYRVECSYLKPASASQQAVQWNASKSPSDEVSPSAVTALQNVPTFQFELKDMELLHFYTTATSVTLTTLQDRQQIWQTVIPRISFSSPFLLRGIIAVSALHMAYLQPERREELRAEASRHYLTALQAFRSELLNVTPENCDACFAFSSLLVIYTWASSDGTGDLFFTPSPSSNQTSVEWISLVRGAYVLLMSAWKWIDSGPLKPLLHLSSVAYSPPKTITSEEKKRFSDLKSLWTSPTSVDPEEVDALNESLFLLEETFCTLPAREEKVPEAGFALAWAVKVPELYMTMVRRRKPEALVILAHFCLLLSRLELGRWWMCGMSSHLLRSIQETMGEEWENWIEWPLHDTISTKC